jgi:hypothetical protein
MLKLAAWAFAATFPSTDTLPGLDRLDPLPFLRQFDREAPLLIRLTLYLSALFLLLSPLLTLGIPLPAAWLSRARLETHLQRIANHRIYLLRQTMLMVKTVGGLAWGAHPEVRRALSIPAYAPDPGTWRA